MNEKSLNAIIKIINHSEKSCDYASSLQFWWEDNRTLEAIVFNLAQIGELVRYIDAEIIEKYNEINWPAMRGLRNRIIHDYDYIKPLVIKKIISDDLPNLIIDLKQLLSYEI